MFEAHEVGHLFLARLGKKRLRPGGKLATNWLIEQSGITGDSKVLEVACNMGTTAIELASRYRCKIIGIDVNKKALELARQRAAERELAECLDFRHGNAVKLPFDDESFDLLINEAMLSMHSSEMKAKIVAEYRRVLKPGGRLLTHDLMIRETADPDIVDRLRAAINVTANPMTKGAWLALFDDQGFSTSCLSGPMSLMSPLGMVRDEGLFGAIRILKNARRKENRRMFSTMYNLFHESRDQFGFVAICSRKNPS